MSDAMSSAANEMAVLVEMLKVREFKDTIFEERMFQIKIAITQKLLEMSDVIKVADMDGAERVTLDLVELFDRLHVYDGK